MKNQKYGEKISFSEPLHYKLTYSDLKLASKPILNWKLIEFYLLIQREKVTFKVDFFLKKISAYIWLLIHGQKLSYQILIHHFNSKKRSKEMWDVMAMEKYIFQSMCLDITNFIKIWSIFSILSIYKIK